MCLAFWKMAFASKQNRSSILGNRRWWIRVTVCVIDRQLLCIGFLVLERRAQLFEKIKKKKGGREKTEHGFVD
jgi:hypothetical protein